jgi:hypothetical protein
MGHNQDWIPGGQDAFTDWSQLFAAGLNAHGTELGIAAALVTEAAEKQAAFMSAWNALQGTGKSSAKSVAKKNLVTAHRLFLRDFFNANLRYNVRLTDELRDALGVPIPDHTHTPIIVGGRRVGFDLKGNGIYLVDIRCWDLDTMEKKILYGMVGIMVLFAVTPEPVTAAALLNESMLITKTRHTFHAGADQRGKWLSVACCWQSASGERGPLSAIQSAVIQ